MEQLEILLKEYSGLLSRMKARDGNAELDKILTELYKQDLLKIKGTQNDKCDYKIHFGL